MNLSEIDRYALARALQGLPPAELMGVSPLVQMLVENWRGRKPDGKDIETARRWFGQQFVTQVFAVDPNDAPPIGFGLEGVPALPKSARMDAPERHVGRWLDEFVKFAKRKAAMTDDLFLESGGLWLLSMAAARRATLELDFKSITNTMYVLWCAGTTYWRKSTGLAAVEDLARRTFPQLLLPSQATPEMLFYRLSGKTPINFDELAPEVQQMELAGQQFAAQRGFISDEASKLFNKKYMEDLPELLMEVYENPPVVEKEFKTQGRLVVSKPGLSLLFATTPSRLGGVFGDGEWEDGLLPRYALLTPTSNDVKRVHATRRTNQHEPSHFLTKTLRTLFEKLPPPQVDKEIGTFGNTILQTIEMQITDEALERFNLYADALHNFCGPNGGIDERLTGVYGRLPVQGLKVAMSLTLIDWAMDNNLPLTITVDHWARAQSIVEKWRASSHRLLTDLNRSSDQKFEDRILEYVKLSHPRPPTRFEIYRGARIHSRKDAFAALDALVDDGRIMRVETGERVGFLPREM